MPTIDTLTQRNQEFAAHQFSAGLPLMPSLRVMIISCADPRVDPANVLGLNPGEAVVIRNVGGRITPGTLQNMALLQAVGEQGPNVVPQSAAAPGDFNLIVLHHTQCGITRLVDKPEMLASYFGIDLVQLADKAVSDPHASVVVDVAALKANPMLPANWTVTGLVYDVTTGLVEVVVPPNTIR